MKYYKNMKKMLLLFAVMLMMLFAGCNKESEKEAKVTPAATETPVPTQAQTQTQTTAELFDAFTEELFLNEISLNTLNLHYTLAHPENFGITEYEPSLGSFNVEGMKQSYGAMRELKAEVEKFTYEELTEEQQLTYDIIMDYIETELSVEDLILYTEVLGPVTGYQAQLPVLLAEYHFRSVQDIEDYLALVALVDELFAEMVEFEKAKSEAGLFMPDYAAEAIIDQCRQFIENPEENYMIDVFETEINAFEGLSEEEKQAYIAKNKELITTELVTAYQTLIDGLEALKGTGTNDKGLYYYEDGKRYYEYLVRSLTGSGKSVEELMTETEMFMNEMMMDMQRVMLKDMDVINRFENPNFCETEPEKILEDLIGKISVDFPELQKVNYKVKFVHPSMQEHMSPAFYLTPPVDDMENHVMYINESQLNDATIYTTMAHEGFPGHLYQNVYAGSKKLPLVRNMFNFQGYTEGWATYVEYYAYGLGLDDANLAKVMELNSAVSLGVQAYVDMGVHYLGWDEKQVAEYLNYYGLESYTQEIFEIVVEEPGNYLSYFIGYMEMMNLRETAEEAWGENFTLKKFHEAVLSLGPAPFDLLEEKIKTYQ